MLFRRLFKGVYQLAGTGMCRDCRDFIAPGARILDLGCGAGIISQAFQDFFAADVTGVDVVDARVTDIPFTMIDGESLPFADGEFDVTLISYVLHHARDPRKLIAEARRVSRRTIIYEDLPEEGLVARILCKVHLMTFDMFFQHNNSSKYHFKTEQDWMDYFEREGMKVVLKRRVSHLPLSRVKLGERILFVLEN